MSEGLYFIIVAALGGAAFWGVIKAMASTDAAYFMVPGFAVALAILMVSSCNGSDAHKARAAAEAAEEAADAVPRLISEKDGCKVYAFKQGYWHYFTRCPNSETSTDTQHSVRSGKTSHIETDTITTREAP